MKKIEDVMSKDLITIKSDTSFDEIIKIMQGKNIGELPVLKNENLIGVITRDDILVKQEKIPMPHVIAFWDILITLPSNKFFEEKLKKISAYKAEDIMSKDVYTVNINDSLEDVITNIVEKKYEFAIVMENNKLKGIITKKDLINNCF